MDTIRRMLESIHYRIDLYGICFTPYRSFLHLVFDGNKVIGLALL